MRPMRSSLNPSANRASVAAVAGATMTSYLAGRFAGLVGSLLVASIVIFLVLEVLPGDPAQFILGSG